MTSFSNVAFSIDIPLGSLPGPTLPLISNHSATFKSKHLYQDISKEEQAAYKAHALEILVECQNRNINIYGDIPKDANILPVTHPSSPIKARDTDKLNPHLPDNMTLVHSFEAGSDASFWASAQVLIGQYPELVNSTKEYRMSLEKRTPLFKIGIGMWQGGRLNWNTIPHPCEGQGFWIEAAKHDIMYLVDYDCYSMGISYRGLYDYNVEMLDLWNQVGNWWINPENWNPCATYRYRVPRNRRVGCWRHVAAANCFVLRQNPSYKADAQACKGNDAC
ncbi:hypothetical protein H072_8774 [Dactylellina haptotyla CBS 200.50]|uniref:Uncharacterized protein n=1 Tax=Dactylellina haptotyla (strain CBS 200.50) TaxID=1284197 RepID=S8A8P8_DACHA|nr:hypothetical protein H072_8774 [Dactylellina haptotyla CBS 200.50]